MNIGRYWRKAHLAIDEPHITQAATLMDRFYPDDQVVEDLLAQIDKRVNPVTGVAVAHQGVL